MIRTLKKLVPDPIKNTYHRVRAYLACLLNGFPAKRMLIIGITGTKGKTSTGNYIWSVLSAGGFNTGLLSTANFRIGNTETANAMHMTMPGAFFIQRTLRSMLEHGVEIAIVEMTSEGMKQYRHAGIPVDIAVFTNLTPEHLGSHGGSFEKYKKAKGRLFKALAHAKKLFKGSAFDTTIVANTDSPHAAYYLGFPASRKITFGTETGDARAEHITQEPTETRFSVGGTEYHLSIPGTFNIYNALPAIVIGRLLGIDETSIQTGLTSLEVIPGRMDKIDEGQDFTVIVDYAHEPAGMQAVLDTAKTLRGPESKIVLLTGCIGGGRESRVPLITIAASQADMLFITTEDPYDSDPSRLIKDLADAAQKTGKVPGKDLFAIEDREEAITKALSLAKSGDIVLITGKGAETTMMTKAGAIPWNEREIVRKLVRSISNKQNY